MVWVGVENESEGMLRRIIYGLLCNIDLSISSESLLLGVILDGQKRTERQMSAGASEGQRVHKP